MRCAFLCEEQVKSCQAAPFRTVLVRAAARPDLERCSSAAHVGCPVAPGSREAHPSLSHCPFLHETLVQFCGLTPLPTYVPWTDSPELRCAHGGHRYCELFAGSTAGGAGEPGPAGAGPRDAATHVVDGVPMPGWLLYAPNHLGLDPGDDGVCHVGLDAFASRLLGPVERLVFLTASGSVRPAVVLSAAGAELTLVFPLPLLLIAVNGRLRSRLDRLGSDPYGLGWLFEARWRVGEGRRAPRPEATLREGEAARQWMAAEVRRASGEHPGALARSPADLTPSPS